MDWGLGHATRCLPLIKELLKEGHSVSFAAPDYLAKFVQTTFPGIKTIPLHGYGITYSKKMSLFTAKIIVQIPKILKAIKREHQWLRQIQKTENFDLIISDNRYGLYHSQVPCVILTHQLQIQSGKGAFLDRWLQKIHYRLLEKFNACWVVDEAGNNNLAGKLAHPKKTPPNARYIGILSQMALFPKMTGTTNHLSSDQTKEILVLLSGPEPMRSLLEVELLKQCALNKGKYHINFIAGKKTIRTENNSYREGILYHDWLGAEQIFPLLQSADIVICRSGYSTLMDLAFLGKKALLIPTPGQTEQEYLAQYLHQKFNTAIVKQDNIQLSKNIETAFLGNPIEMNSSMLESLNQSIKNLTEKKLNNIEH